MIFFKMKQLKQRSACPVSSSLDILGDKWMLLLLRDMLFADKSTYGEFLQSAEKIATNILADRLALLESQELVSKEIAADKKSKFTYRLTEKGIDLLPVVVELMLWGTRYCPTIAEPALLAALIADKDGTTAHYRRLAREKMRAG